MTNPCCSCKLNTCSGPKAAVEHVLLEMTKDEADRMLRSMDAIWEVRWPSDNSSNAPTRLSPLVSRLSSFVSCLSAL